MNSTIIVAITYKNRYDITNPEKLAKHLDERLHGFGVFSTADNESFEILRVRKMSDKQIINIARNITARKL